MTASTDIQVDQANQDQLRAWDGGEGEYWADNAEHFDRAIASYHQNLLAAATINQQSRVLDIGCGNGQTTRDAAREASHGSALGVDLSSRMLANARARAKAEGLTNASFLQADAQVHPFERSTFDVAISRTGTMFFADPIAAFSNIGRALTPGGRLAIVVWQGVTENEWLREISGALAAGRDLPAPPPGVPGPFAFAEPDRAREVLEASGFTDVELAGASQGMWFGKDVDDALRFVLGLMGWMLEGLDDAGRARAIDALHATLTAHATDDGVVFGSGTWTITATRA